MGGNGRFQSAAKWTAGIAGIGLGAYAAYAAATWLSYGRPSRPRRDGDDPMLDRLMPTYEVAERYHIRIAAPAEITFAAACDMDLMRSPIIQAIFRTRELVLGAEHARVNSAAGMLQFSKSVGWNVVAEIPEREVVMAAVTQPWNAEVVFHPLSADEFVAFDEPGFVKIAWTLRADPDGDGRSIFRHETRVATTDRAARAKFRDYWAVFSPGIKLIRLLILRPLRAEAERRAAATHSIAEA